MRVDKYKRTGTTLSLREQAFVDAYLAGQNATESARIAYPPKSPGATSVRGFTTLRSPKVREAIRKGFRTKNLANNLKHEDLIARARILAFGDMSHFLEARDGFLVLKNAEDISAEELSTVQSCKVLRTTTRIVAQGTPDEAQVTEQVIELKLHSPDASLDKLFKFSGLYFEASDLKLIRDDLEALKREQAQRSKLPNGLKEISHVDGEVGPRPASAG
jgi:hypothetical protein